jgi:molecular chaperone DnaK (HSP70)
MHNVQQMVEELSGGKVPVLRDVPVDLAVCHGCAIEAYELSGKSTHVLPIKKMLDVSSFDIGVAAHKLSDTDPNRMFVGCIIPKGTPLPVSKSRRFGVASMPGSSGLAAELIICEGTEDQEYKDAMKVQSFTLTGIAPGSDPEKPRIEVTISVDASGIVTAEAMDIETGQKIRQQIDRKAIQ